MEKENKSKGTVIYIGVAEGDLDPLDLVWNHKDIKRYDLGYFVKGHSIKDFTPEKYKEFIETISKKVWESMQKDKQVYENNTRYIS